MKEEKLKGIELMKLFESAGFSGELHTKGKIIKFGKNIKRK